MIPTIDIGSLFESVSESKGQGATDLAIYRAASRSGFIDRKSVV